MSRADKITIEDKKLEYFSDFTNDFFKNPVTGYLSRVVNEESIKQSIKNLIFTNKGERFYSPSVGSTIKSSLFDPLDATAIIAIRQTITETINNFERRAQLLDVIVTPYIDENAVFIKIIFSIINFKTEAYNLEIIVKRTR